VIAACWACVPLYFLLFLPADASGVRSTATIVSEQFAMPSALQWKGVAERIAKDVKDLPASAVVSMAVAAFAAVAIELLRIVTMDRFPLSAVAIGLGVVQPPDAVLAMFAGALLIWLMGMRHKSPGSRGHRIWVEGCEPICAVLISGAALMVIGNAVLNAVF
jgi:uncharacterized oligopeptide transporter (OPT) family protein